MRHLGKIGILCVLASGCSLIVGGKLDEKASDARPQATEAGKIDQLPHDGSVLPLLGKETVRPFFVVGEAFAIPGAHPEWNKKKVLISGTEGDVFCPAALDGQNIMRGVIPSHSPEGKLKLSVLDGTNVLFSSEIEVRRLVLVGAEGERQIRLFSNDPFEPIPDATIDLGAPLQGGRALLAPSGRFLLASTGPTPQDAKLVLIDLVTGKLAGLNVRGFESSIVPGGIPHSFEPVFGPMPQTGQDLPLLLHYREERVWVVTADGSLWSHEIEALFKGSPKAQGHGSQVQQVLWAAVPAEVPRSVGLIVRNQKNSVAPFYKHALIKGTSKPSVIQNDDLVPGFATYATPLDGVKLRPEVAFALLLHSGAGERQIALISESGTMTPPKVLDYGIPAKKLAPESLTAIPGTALVGFNFMAYPSISAADTLFGKLTIIGSSLQLQVERRLGGIMLAGQRTDTFPSLRGRDRLLIRSGEKLSTFDELAAAPKWSDTIAALTWAAHHPRRETVYASAVGVLHQYNYGGAKPGHLQSPAINLPTVGVYIQP